MQVSAYNVPYDRKRNCMQVDGISFNPQKMSYYYVPENISQLKIVKINISDKHAKQISPTLV